MRLLSWRLLENVVANRIDQLRQGRIDLFSPNARADGQSFTELHARRLLAWGDGHADTCKSCGHAKSREARNLKQVPGLTGHVERGGVLLSHQVPLAVPSALAGLASGFGMGPGVSPPP